LNTDVSCVQVIIAPLDSSFSKVAGHAARRPYPLYRRYLSAPAIHSLMAPARFARVAATQALRTSLWRVFLRPAHLKWGPRVRSVLTGDRVSETSWMGLFEQCSECKFYFTSTSLKTHITLKRRMGEVIVLDIH
jgi:hypothetical protein